MNIPSSDLPGEEALLDVLSDENLERKGVTKRDFLKLGLGLLTFGPAILAACGQKKKEGEETEEGGEGTGEALEIPKLLEEPQSKEMQELIDTWELIYRGETETLAARDRHVTGYGEARLSTIVPPLLEDGFHLSGEYMDQIRYLFALQGVPIELADLFFSESHFNNKIGSPAGARGIGQFMPATAREYGMENSSKDELDERCDVLICAEKTAEYLYQLARRYPEDSWLWAMLAYNRGMSKIDKEYRACGGDFEKYIKKMSDLVENGNSKYAETMNYVAKFFAIRRVVHGTDKHKPLSERVELLPPLDMDTIDIAYNNTRIHVYKVRKGDVLGKIAEKYGVSVRELQKWNAMGRRTTIYPDREMRIVEKPDQLTFGRVARTLGLSMEIMCAYNQALPCEQDIAGKNLNLADFKIPEGYSLRLPADFGEQFVEKFGTILVDKADSCIEQIRPIKNLDHEIAKLLHKALKESQKRSPADVLYEEALALLRENHIEPQTIIAKLEQVYELYGKEAAEKVHTNAYVQNALEVVRSTIIAQNEKMKSEEVLGAKISEDKPEEVYAQAEKALEQADKEDAEELSDIANVCMQALKNESKDQAINETCREVFIKIQNDAAEVINGIFAEIERGQFAQKKLMIPEDFMQKLNEAYELGMKIFPFIMTRKGSVEAGTSEAVPSAEEQEKIAIFQEFKKDIEFFAEHNKAVEAAMKKDLEKAVKEQGGEHRIEKVSKGKEEFGSMIYGLERKVERNWTYWDLKNCYGVSQAQIEDANRWLKGRPLPKGKKIVIPVFYMNYKIKEGDVISKIAERFGVSKTRIYNANYGVKDRLTQLQPGTVIQIVYGPEKPGAARDATDGRVEGRRGKPFRFEKDLLEGSKYREDVEKLEKILKDLAFFDNGKNVEGKFEAIDEEALTAFQLAFHIIKDAKDHGAGRAGPKTREALNVIVEHYDDLFLDDLRYKDKNDAVLRLQHRLQELGLIKRQTKIKGNFGKITLDAVHDYQRAHGIKPDEVVGPKTRTALNREMIAGWLKAPAAKR